MIRNKAARMYYSVYSLIDGSRLIGDAANHTVYYTSTDTWETLSDIHPTEISDGVYTFELPKAKTDVDTAVCMIKSDTPDTLAAIIELVFTSSVMSLDTDALNDIATKVSAIMVGNDTLPEGLGKIYDGQAAINNTITAINTKFSSYPAGASIPVKTDIPSADTIAQTVLTTDISGYSSPGEYSLTSMICGGFCSTMDVEKGWWTITRPSGSTIAKRNFETSEELKPITRVW